MYRFLSVRSMLLPCVLPPKLVSGKSHDPRRPSSPGCSTRGHELHIGHTDKTENGLQIRIDKVQRARRSARRIDSTAGREDRSLLAMEHSLRSAFGIHKRVSFA